jgi:DNA-binding NarL/FixJ family response regulator
VGSLTPEERAAIDAAIAAGKVTRVPMGGTSTTTYVWDGRQLVTTDPDRRGGQYANQRKSAARKNSLGITPTVERRRAQLMSLKADGFSAQQIADRVGVSVQTIYADAKFMKLSFERPVRVEAPKSRHDRSGVEAARMLVRDTYDGRRTVAQIAAVTGLPDRTVRDHIGALRLPVIKADRAAVAKSAADKIRLAWDAKNKPRRDEIARLAADGLSFNAISAAMKLNANTLSKDIKALGLKLTKAPRATRKAAGEGGDRLAQTKDARAERDRAKVRDRRRFKTTPVATGAINRVAPESATGTIFPGQVQIPSAARRVLVDGASNSKIGGDVLVGHLKGARIVTLTLEERATCPTSCALWRGCYGNNMQYSTRWKNGPELLTRIEADLIALFRDYSRVLVRLHVLGDFWSGEYVDFWRGVLIRHAGLTAFGFTAWSRDTPVGQAVADLRAEFPRRFMVRHSGVTGPWGAFTIDFPTERKTLGDAIVCPEQRDAVNKPERQTHCGSCAACWSTDRPIVFIEH